MHIKIAERLHPYSHTPGVKLLLPGSLWQLEIFPALIRIYDATQAIPKVLTEIELSIDGPINDFTAMLDLEHAHICVYGHGSAGFMRYRLQAMAFPGIKAHSLAIHIEKTPPLGLTWSVGEPYSMQKGQNLEDSSYFELGAVAQKTRPKDVLLLDMPFPQPININGEAKLQPLEPYSPPAAERLSLGNHKSQDWDMVCRRRDLTEVLPAWLRLNQLIPYEGSLAKSKKGTLALLSQCEKSVQEKDKIQLVKVFLNLLTAGFHGILVPSLNDERYQGFNLEKVLPGDALTPLLLLRDGARSLRGLFIETAGDTLRILPALPPEFHCGRFVDVECAGLGQLDMEWSKKNIRRMIFRAALDGSIFFAFQNHVKTMRVRQGTKDRGRIQPAEASVQIEKGKEYFLDDFEM